MKKPLLLFACLIVSLQAIGDDVKCKCNEVPFEPDPPCAKACIVSIIRYSNFDKLVAAAELSRPQQKAIVNVRLEEAKNKTVYSMGEGVKVLPGDLYRLLNRAHGVYKTPYLIEDVDDIELKLFMLPSDQLRKIVMTLPVQVHTVTIPDSRVRDFEFNPKAKLK